MNIIIRSQRIKFSSSSMKKVTDIFLNNSNNSTRCVYYNSPKLLNIVRMGDHPILERIQKHSNPINAKILGYKIDGSEFLKLSRYYATETPKENNQSNEPPVTLFQKMKQLTKNYWHILIPVHVFTSVVWISIFYVAVKNGVDIVAILKYLNLSDTYLEKIRNSNAGHWAVTYALYKVATPFRYTVTIGGTTMTIRYLNKLGIMKFKTPEKMKGILSNKSTTQQKTKNNDTEIRTKVTGDSSKT